MDTASSPSGAATAASEQASTEASESQVSDVNQDVPEWKRVKHKVPVKGDDGNELEVDYDELVKNFALNKTITQRGQDAAKTKKEADATLQAFQRDLDACRGNPKLLFELAKSMGIDDAAMQEAAEERIWNKIQLDKIKEDPEKYEAYIAKKERDELRAEKEEREDAAKKEEYAKADAALETEVEDGVLEAVKLSGLKPNPRLIARIAELYQSSLNTSDKLPSPDVIAKKVRDWYHQDHGELYGDDASIDELIQAGLLPDKLLTKIQKYLLDKASKNVPSFGSSRQATSSSGNKAPRQKVGIDEFFKKL